MRHKKLWELDARFHCPVIGTCLTLEELRRLARKAGIVGGTASEYELHRRLVHAAESGVYDTRLVQKWLDRKFAPVLARFHACKSPAGIEALWERVSAAAFWALLTHPLASAELVQRAYGEVRMLSHLAGHSNHSARHDLAMLKRRVAELEEVQAWTAEASRLRIKELERRAEELAERAQRVDVLERELAATRTRLTALESGEALARLDAEKESLAQKFEHVLWRSSAPDTQAAPTLTAISTDSASPEAPGGRCPPQCDAAEAGDCPGPDLCGRRVLYVGGRNRQVAHFRGLVARRNGELLHHDGGLSESTARLDAMIHRADAVLYPVDCVSHDACLRIKHLCKRTTKRFVPLRTASLACFLDGLREVTA